MLLNLRITLVEAAVLFLLFVSQLVVPWIRMEVSIVYLVLTAVLLVVWRKHIIPMVREGLLSR